MISSKTQKWIEVGKILAEDTEGKVLCPECEQNELQVQDVRSELDPDIIERKMYCSVCGAKNYLRLIRPI